VDGAEGGVGGEGGVVREKSKNGTHGQSCSGIAKKITKCGYIGWVED
jgi:hypothetical protein